MVFADQRLSMRRTVEDENDVRSVLVGYQLKNLVINSKDVFGLGHGFPSTSAAYESKMNRTWKSKLESGRPSLHNAPKTSQCRSGKSRKKLKNHFQTESGDKQETRVRIEMSWIESWIESDVAQGHFNQERIKQNSFWPWKMVPNTHPLRDDQARWYCFVREIDSC